MKRIYKIIVAAFLALCIIPVTNGWTKCEVNAETSVDDATAKIIAKLDHGVLAEFSDIEKSPKLRLGKNSVVTIQNYYGVVSYTATEAGKYKITVSDARVLNSKKPSKDKVACGTKIGRELNDKIYFQHMPIEGTDKQSDVLWISSKYGISHPDDIKSAELDPKDFTTSKTCTINVKKGEMFYLYIGGVPMEDSDAVLYETVKVKKVR